MTKRMRFSWPEGNATVDIKCGALLNIFDHRGPYLESWHAEFVKYIAPFGHICMVLRCGGGRVIIKAFGNKRRHWKVVNA